MRIGGSGSPNVLILLPPTSLVRPHLHPKSPIPYPVRERNGTEHVGVGSTSPNLPNLLRPRRGPVKGAMRGLSSRVRCLGDPVAEVVGQVRRTSCTTCVDLEAGEVKGVGCVSEDVRPTTGPPSSNLSLPGSSRGGLG